MLSDPDHAGSGWPRSKRKWLGILAVLLIAVGLALSVLALDRSHSSSDGGVGVPRVPTPSTPLQSAESDEAAPTPVRSPQDHAATGVPVSLALPTLNVSAPVIRIEMTQDTVLWPPDNPRELGWWRSGAPPGAATGSALIVGHAMSTGGGAFDNLERLERGDPVRVRTRRGLIRYGVTSVRIYRKASLARDAQRIFSQSGPGRLVLITCEDWNGETWLSNAIVIARPKPS